MNAGLIVRHTAKEKAILKKAGVMCVIPREKKYDEYMAGVLFALATLEIHGSEVQAEEIVQAVGGLKAIKKGICAEQDEETYRWLKEICR